jgi:hypothetical protein
MRTTYHLQIRNEDDHKIQRALKTLGVEPDFRLVTTGKDSVVDYTVDLSKYELLYVRLSTRIMRAVNVTDWEAEQKTKTHD